MRSLYELLHPSGVVAKQRVVDNFSGDALNERWTESNITGSVTWSMEDTINEGLKGVTDTTSFARGMVSFNNKRQYDVRNFVYIAEVKSVTTTETMLQCGMCDDLSSTPEKIVFVANQDDPTDEWQLESYDGITASGTGTGIAVDADWHSVKLEGNSTGGKMWLDGDFMLMKTTDIPASAKAQPRFEVLSRNSTASEGRIRYMECYNT